MSTNPIFDITPFTTLDFPDHLACIVWFAGCNMRCRYCYNADIVLGRGKKSEQDLLDFLQIRIGKLEAVVLSGGECTLYGGLFELCRKIKKLGFKIKLDTNGSYPNTLKELLRANLLSFVSLDFKAPKEIFREVTLSNFYDNAVLSLDILLSNPTPFEVRTTVHTDILSEKDINEIIEILCEKGYKNSYFLQKYLHANTIGNLNEPSKRLDANLLSDKLPIEFRNF